MRNIGHRAGEPYEHDLDILAESRGVIEDGIIGLRVRLDALRMGKYGRLFTAVETGKPGAGLEESAVGSVRYLRRYLGDPGERRLASCSDVSLRRT